MSNTKTEAQRLADAVEVGGRPGGNRHLAAAELRRLDAENQQLRAQLAKAVAEEREACAKVCDGMSNKAIDGSPMQLGLDLAADAIRARSNT